MREVATTEPLDLRVELRKVAARRRRIVRKVDPQPQVLRADGNLLGFGQGVVDHTIEH